MLEDEADLAVPRVRVGGVLALERHAAFVRSFEAGDHSQQRRLARSRRSQQREQLAGLDVQVDVIDGDKRPEALDDAVQFYAHVTCSKDACRECVLRSTTSLSASVTRASSASSDATAKAAANWYSL